MQGGEQPERSPVPRAVWAPQGMKASQDKIPSCQETHNWSAGCRDPGDLRGQEGCGWQERRRGGQLGEVGSQVQS